MKKPFIIGNIIIFILLVSFIFLPGRIESQFESQMQELGFKHADIGRVSLGFKNITLTDIKLNKDGSHTIAKMKAKGFWPTYIFTKKIQSLEISKLEINTRIKKPSPLFFLKNKINVATLHNLPIDKISIKNALLNVETNRGIIPFKSDGIIIQDGDNKNITFNLNATSQLLTTSSNWESVLQPNNIIQVEVKITEAKMNMKPVKINRAAGWISYNNKNGHVFSGQIDAGSGSIVETPINNVSLLIGKNKENYPLLLRAEAAGVDGVTLTADMDITPSSNNYAVTSSLSIKNGADFLEYIRKNYKNITDESSNSAKFNNSEVLLTYLADRRFADGPLPFELSMRQKDKELLNGHILIYPKTLDVRGTAQTFNGVEKTLIPLFSIPKDKISDNVIRLDGNIKDLVYE